jgi:glycosyltransferase involved in cell wall biosynthesis
VAVGIAGTREIIQNGKNGILCRGIDLGDSILRVLKDGELRNALVRNGLEMAKEFDMDGIAGRYEEIYKKARGLGLILGLVECCL